MLQILFETLSNSRWEIGIHFGRTPVAGTIMRATIFLMRHIQNVRCEKSPPMGCVRKQNVRLL